MSSCHLQASSPACTELESLVMDWLGQAIGLPQEFLHKTPVSVMTSLVTITLSSIIRAAWAAA